LERLECRTQPGSLLLSSGLPLLASSLDVGGLPPDSSQNAHVLSIVHRRINDSTSTGQSGQVATIAYTPVQVTRSAPAAPAQPLDPTTPNQGSELVFGLPPGPRANHAFSAPRGAALPQAVSVAAPTVYNSPPLVPNNNVRPVNTGSDGGIGPQFTTGFSTYVGGPGEDVYTRDKFTAGGLYLAGSVTDPSDSTAQDLAVAKLANNGASYVISPHLFNFGAGTKFWSRGLDVAADGTTYVSGFIGANPKNKGIHPSNLEIVSINPTLTAVNWTVGFADSTVRTAVYSVKLDAAGTNLYFDGDEDLSSIGLPQDNLLAGKLTGLTNPTPTVVYQHAYVFQDSSMNPAATVVGFVAGASGIAPDAAGNADFVTNFNDNAGNNSPLFGQIAPDGGSINSAHIYPNSGPRGMGTDITVDSGNNYLFTGSFSPAGSQTNLVEAKWTQSNTQVFGYNWAFSGVDGPINAFGAGIREDASGNVYTSATLLDPNQPSTSNLQLEVDKFSPDNFLDGTLGRVGGTMDDYGLGIDLGGINNTAYVVGTTNSTDFDTTPGVVQPTYGGGPQDGYALSIQF
jgi:hypothetical protein